MDKMLEAIRTGVSHGLELHWLYPKSKRPVGEWWSTHPKRTLEELEKAYRKGLNLGVRTGRWSTPEKGKGLIIIDKDVRSADPRQALEAQEPWLRSC